MKVAATAAGVSQSRWVAGLIQEKTATQWPESLVKLAGSWSHGDFPSLEEIRAGMGEDLPDGSDLLLNGCGPDPNDMEN